MNRYQFHLQILTEQYLDYYRGVAQHVIVRCADGQTVQFPASLLRWFVSEDGIQGDFELSDDEHHQGANLAGAKHRRGGGRGKQGGGVKGRI